MQPTTTAWLNLTAHCPSCAGFLSLHCPAGLMKIKPPHNPTSQCLDIEDYFPTKSLMTWFWNTVLIIQQIKRPWGRIWWAHGNQEHVHTSMTHGKQSDDRISIQILRSVSVHQCFACIWFEGIAHGLLQSTPTVQPSVAWLPATLTSWAQEIKDWSSLDEIRPLCVWGGPVFVRKFFCLFHYQHASITSNNGNEWLDWCALTKVYMFRFQADGPSYRPLAALKFKILYVRGNHSDSDGIV